MALRDRMIQKFIVDDMNSNTCGYLQSVSFRLAPVQNDDLCACPTVLDCLTIFWGRSACSEMPPHTCNFSQRS